MIYVRHEVGGSIVATQMGFVDATCCFTNGTLRGCAVAVTRRAKPSDKVASRSAKRVQEPRGDCMTANAKAVERLSWS